MFASALILALSVIGTQAIKTTVYPNFEFTGDLNAVKSFAANGTLSQCQREAFIRVHNVWQWKHTTEGNTCSTKIVKPIPSDILRPAERTDVAVCLLPPCNTEESFLGLGGGLTILPVHDGDITLLGASNSMNNCSSQVAASNAQNSTSFLSAVWVHKFGETPTCYASKTTKTSVLPQYTTGVMLIDKDLRTAACVDFQLWFGQAAYNVCRVDPVPGTEVPGKSRKRALVEKKADE